MMDPQLLLGYLAAPARHRELIARAELAQRIATTRLTRHAGTPRITARQRAGVPTPSLFSRVRRRIDMPPLRSTAGLGKASAFLISGDVRPANA